MITLALACGIFTAASAAKSEKPWANGKLQVSANQRFLQFENGQPFFLLGDTGWLLPERLDRAEAQYYLHKCRVAGFNTVLIQVMDGTPSFNIYGQQSLLPVGICRRLTPLVFTVIGIISTTSSNLPNRTASTSAW